MLFGGWGIVCRVVGLVGGWGVRGIGAKSQKCFWHPEVLGRSLSAKTRILKSYGLLLTYNKPKLNLNIC